MLKKSNKALSNKSEGVMFLLRGAQKRRSMAAATAKMIQGDLGMLPRLFSLK